METMVDLYRDLFPPAESMRLKLVLIIGLFMIILVPDYNGALVILLCSCAFSKFELLYYDYATVNVLCSILWGVMSKIVWYMLDC
jgi:hypothetical protein